MGMDLENDLQIQLALRREEAARQELYGPKLALNLRREFLPWHRRVAGNRAAEAMCQPPEVWVSQWIRSTATLQWAGRDLESIGRIDTFHPDTGDWMERSWALTHTPSPEDDDRDPLGMDGFRNRSVDVGDDEIKAKAPELVAFWEANMQRTLDQLLSEQGVNP